MSIRIEGQRGEPGGKPSSGLQIGRISRTQLLGGLTCAVIVAVSSLLGCSAGSKPSTARASTQIVVPVAVATAEQRDVPVYLKGLGSVTASNTVSVKSRVDGQLAQINFKEGQHVNQGDLLAVIDPRPFQLALEQSQANLFRDQAQLKDAQRNYERFKSLFDELGSDFTTAGGHAKGRRRTVGRGSPRRPGADRQCEIERGVLAHHIARLAAASGCGWWMWATWCMRLTPNPLLVITQLQPIAVVFTLPEDNLLTVSQHMRQSTLPVEAYSRDDQTKLATGKLLTIDNQIDQTTGTGRLKAMFDNPDDALWPNQFVNVRLLLETHKNSIVIPSVAVQTGPQGRYVFTVKPDKTVAVSPVTVSFTQNNVASISQRGRSLAKWW